MHYPIIYSLGEVAHQKNFVPFLIGIGIKRLSVSPKFLPVLQKTIFVGMAQIKRSGR